MLVICLLVFPLVDWFTRVNLLTGELTEGLYASYTVAAPCSFGCWDDTPANGQAVLCGPHSDSCHKRQTVYCGPNSDPFIQAPKFEYFYQNPLTIYLAFNFGNIFKIPFNTCSLYYSTSTWSNLIDLVTKRGFIIGQAVKMWRFKGEFPWVGKWAQQVCWSNLL